MYKVRTRNVARPPGADEELTRLVKAAADGDHRAWDSLVARYVALLWSIAFRHGLNESDAADVVQNTWLRLFEHIDDLDQREAAVIRMRFGLDAYDAMTLREVGENLGLTRERVRQLEHQALQKLMSVLCETSEPLTSGH